MRTTAWRAEILPECEVVHLSRDRDARYDAEKLRRYHESLVRFFGKHYGDREVRRLRRVLILRSLIRIGLWASLYLVAPGRRRERAERVRGYAGVLRSMLANGRTPPDGRLA